MGYPDGVHLVQARLRFGQRTPAQCRVRLQDRVFHARPVVP
eukprot:CAMPEP_0118992772 /NCGR_PEP_ID=MMETSP1173-20130426/53959_1 /TAXON_ID=1034831 /ORGANISM="Rhizochromulina marina cf, Strain CCMP1243" /LENGTH=40 /DNA_ID= /DNA_START= /DNA_END= /DNA_ORIENTATION=